MKYMSVLSIALLLAVSWGCSGSAEAGKNAPAQTGERSEVNAALTFNAEPSATPVPVKGRGGQRVAEPAKGPPPLQFRPAAEDSEIATSMNEMGQVVETRVFKRHPTISRVVAVWKKPKMAELRISLKNGEALDVKTEKLINLQSATTRDLMEIAGIPLQRGTTRSEKKPE